MARGGLELGDASIRVKGDLRSSVIVISARRFRRQDLGYLTPQCGTDDGYYVC